MNLEQINLDDAYWTAKLAEIAQPALTQYVILGADGARMDLYRVLVTGGMLGDDAVEIAGSWTVHNPAVSEWLDTYAFQFAQKVNQTTADALRAAIKEGLEAGESIGELKARVMDVFGPEMSKQRAEMIARTESHRAELQGRQSVWKEANRDAILAGEQPVIIGRRWKSSPDACGFCQSMDGTTIGVDEVYFPKGSTYELEGEGAMKLDYEDVDTATLHPHCRCDEEAVINPVYL